jgi:hypothetical protein
MTTETNRREFEEWAAKEDYDVRKSKYDPKYYMFISTQSSWEAWQAARAKQSEIICRKCGLREERGEKPNFDF